MVPSHEKTHLARRLKASMALFAEQKSSRYDRTMAKSQEFNDLILYLCQRAPLEMRGVFKIAFQKCEDALHGEKDTRASRKRAQQSNVDKRDSKRVKITCEIGEETTRQTEVDDEDGLTTEDDLKATWQKGNMTALPTQYEIEAGLEEESPVIVDFVKASLVKFRSPMIHSMSYAQDEINKVWRIIPMLEFYTTRRELSQHLENREKMPGEKLHARTDWNISEPSEILDALDNVKRSTLDNKIHRAYGQMMLFSSVNAEVERGYHSHVTGYRSDHAELLEELAREKAGSVSKTEIDQIITSYAYEYQTGQKWLPVIDWFGGSGIILIFMIAGIGSWQMRSWTEFQRVCVQHIAGLLGSIRRLVETLGPDALERYCQNGCLGSDCLDKVKQAEFTQPDTDKECEEDSD